MHSDKMAKKQPFTLTPDIHTKTYAERSGLGGIAATGFGPGPITGINASGAAGGSASLNATQNHGYRHDSLGTANLHQSAKNKN